MKRLPGLLLAFLVLASCGGRRADPVPCDIAGIKNCTRVGDLLFGGQPSNDTLARLAADGYRTILSTRGEDELDWDERAIVDSLGMTFVSIPMPYPIEGITDEQVDRFAEVLENGERPMLLHCASGNRVSGLWAVWLAERQDLPKDEAVRLGKLAGMTRVRSIVEKRLAQGRRRD